MRRRLYNSAGGDARTTMRNFAFRRRMGFTLVEMLVVISIIVVVIGMSIPLFRSMSTDRSVESGQNIVSAMLQRARSRALGLQSPRGVFFFEDQATKKTAMVMVRLDEPSSVGNPAANVLELDEESDEFQFLPNMVGAAFVLGADPAGSGTAGPGTSIYRPYGLIVFDESGRVMQVPSYSTFASGDPRYPVPLSSPSDPRNTRLWDRYRNNIGTGTVDVIGTLGKSTVPRDQQFSSAVVMLYDKVPFAVLPTPAVGPPYFVMSTGAGSQSEWLDNNGLALSVNRYNGTIINSK